MKWERWLKRNSTKSSISKKESKVVRLKGGKGSGHFDHAGRPGEQGGSLPKGDSSPSIEDLVEKLRISNKNITLRFEMSPNRKVDIWRDPEVTAESTLELAKNIIMDLPPILRSMSLIRRIEIYDSPEDSDRRVEELVPDLYVPGAQAMFNRDNGTLVAPIWSTGDTENNGKVLLHEFGHSLDYLISSQAWNDLGDEWAHFNGNYYDQDEGFAEVFSQFIIDKKEYPEDVTGADGFWTKYKPGLKAYMEGLGL
jgi:hypothetical protein